MGTVVNINIQLVQDLKIRSRNAKEVLGICPVCGCRDANFNISKLVWRCWHCPSSGIIISEDGNEYIVEEEELPVYDILEIRKLYTSLASKYNDSLFADAFTYLKDRGFTEDTISKYKLGFCSTDFYDEYTNDVAEDSGIVYKSYPVLSNRVVIPYIVGDEVTDLRGRVLDSVFKYKDGTPTYISLVGNHVSRGATYLFNHDIIEKEDTIIITEGEFKALLAIQHGFPVVATPGIFGWNKEWSPLFKGKEVILAADRDNISGTRSPAYLMARSLYREIPHLKVATLYKAANEKKVDIDSMILTRGVKSFQNAIDGALPAKRWLELEERKGHGRRR